MPSGGMCGFVGSSWSTSACCGLWTLDDGCQQASRSIIELVIAKSDLDAALAARGTAAGATVVDKLVDSSSLGSALFSDMKLIVTAAGFAKELEGELDKMMTEHITAQVHEANKAKLNAIAEHHSSSGFLELRRRCTVGYGPFQLDLVITDPVKEAQLRYAARLKSQALGAPGGLDYLPLEEHLFQRPTAACKIDNSVLQEFKSARSMMSDVMHSDSMDSFSNVAASIAKASEAFLAIDGSSILEVEFITTSMRDCLSKGLD